MERASLLVLWLYFLIVHSPICIRSNEEGDALYAFKKVLSDPDEVLASWSPSFVNPCTWFHVSCDPNNYVTRVDLGSSNLKGPLVPNLRFLKKLQYLELYGNKLNGSIPVELGYLTSLVSLDLDDNSLTGPIPKELANLKNLMFLRLNDNMLNGTLPSALDLVSSKEVFPQIVVANLTNNKLECPCPGCSCSWIYPPQ